MERAERGSWSENILDYFLSTNQIKTRDGAEIIWYHAANNKSQIKEAIQSAAHMVEADILLCGEEEGNGEPIMAHPPETNSDNTLQEWLNEIVNTKKGIKLDFKSLAAVQPSMMLLEGIKLHLKRPVWINADILPGPNGSNAVVDAKTFLDTVTSFFPDVTLSLGWTTGWHPHQCNKGYSWEMVKEMAQICGALTQPVTFPVRASLLQQSKSELLWLLQKSNRYSLTVWTGRQDEYFIEDLLYIRETFDKSNVRRSGAFRPRPGMDEGNWRALDCVWQTKVAKAARTCTVWLNTALASSDSRRRDQPDIRREAPTGTTREEFLLHNCIKKNETM